MVATTIFLPLRGERKRFIVIPEAAQAAIRDPGTQRSYRPRADPARPPWVPALRCASARVTEGFSFRASPSEPCEKPRNHQDKTRQEPDDIRQRHDAIRRNPDPGTPSMPGAIRRSTDPSRPASPP